MWPRQRRHDPAPLVRLLKDACIGYAPYSPALDRPGDRRRFCFYAKAGGLSFEVTQQPTPRHDLVVVTSTADITRWARADSSITVVYDLIDSYLAVDRHNVKSLGRGVAKRLSGETSRLALSYRRAIEAMCARANAVICTTTEQREQILRFCPNVHVILDDHGAEASVRKQNFDAHAPFRLVWEGLPYTLPAFGEIRSVLDQVQRRHALELHLITDLALHSYANRFLKRSTEAFAGRYVSNFYLHEWRQETLAREIASCDLAIIPALLGDPLFAGKPENKLLLFWRMGMPTVTSATPAYERAMLAAGLDMTCRDTQAWEEVLEHYIVDRVARELAGTRGHGYVSAEHSAASRIARWDELFASVGFGS